MAVGRNAEALAILRRKGYRGPAEVVPNGVDLGLFRPLDRAMCRKALRLDTFTAGYVGRLVEEKGLMDLVESLAKSSGRWQVVLVGEGDFRSALEQRAKELGVAARVRFFPARPLHELPTLMNALDVLILPSRTTARWKEQFGRVIIEAHACATPVVGSDSGAIPTVVGRGGMVVPERNPERLAAAIDALAGDLARCRSLGEYGRQQVLASCSWARVAERMRQIYSRVGASKSMARPVYT
jgi:glycosyltransferase involved in cell wall biosynthesis